MMAETPKGGAPLHQEVDLRLDSSICAVVSDEILRHDRATCGAELANDGAAACARLPNCTEAIDLARAKQRADGAGWSFIEIMPADAQGRARRAPPGGRGCAKGGGVIDLVVHMRELDFREAIEFLTGEDATQPKATPSAKPAASEPASEESNAFVERLIANIVRELVPFRGRKASDTSPRSARSTRPQSPTCSRESTPSAGIRPSCSARKAAPSTIEDLAASSAS
jgi:hypothetical protein